jgi:AcrR family transcriptional regulator
MTTVRAQEPARGPRRAGRRKTQVLDAAAKVVAQRGADATRFTDVADSSGVPVSTLQYYFGSRDDLLVATFRHASSTEIQALAAELATIADPWDRLVRLLDRALAAYTGQAETGRLWIESWRFAMRDDEMRTDVHRDYTSWRELVQDTVRAGAAAGRFTPRQTPERIALIAIALIDGLGIPLSVGDPAVPPAEARHTLHTTIAQLLALPTAEIAEPPHTPSR